MIVYIVSIQGSLINSVGLFHTKSPTEFSRAFVLLYLLRLNYLVSLSTYKFFFPIFGFYPLIFVEIIIITIPKVLSCNYHPKGTFLHDILRDFHLRLPRTAKYKHHHSRPDRTHLMKQRDHIHMVFHRE